jgi:hypothetical protein
MENDEKRFRTSNNTAVIISLLQSDDASCGWKRKRMTGKADRLAEQCMIEPEVLWLPWRAGAERSATSPQSPPGAGIRITCSGNT